VWTTNTLHGIISQLVDDVLQHEKEYPVGSERIWFRYSNPAQGVIGCNMYNASFILRFKDHLNLGFNPQRTLNLMYEDLTSVYHPGIDRQTMIKRLAEREGDIVSFALNEPIQTSQGPARLFELNINTVNSFSMDFVVYFPFDVELSDVINTQ
jgi:hypothetical protein